MLYAHRSVSAAQNEARFAAKQLKLRKKDLLLDLCCGNGRHLLELSAIAARCVGLDFSAQLLGLARSAVGHGAGLVRGDMRHLPFGECFDVVTNFFTSFGYFPGEKENTGAVVEMAGALKPGGRFFIDHMNRDYVARNLEPESERERGEYLIREQRWIDGRRRRVNKITRVLKDGTLVTETSESVRMYRLKEFTELLADAGLAVDRVFGDYAGAGFGPDHPRMIVVGHKE